MASKKFYLTTPLYYVNARPHIGHAYTNVLCDTFARWHRLRGEDVFFLTGTDEHGTKIEKAARGENKEPARYVDEMVPPFKALWELLGIHYDDFIRTTEERHKRVVHNILRGLEAKGDIYKAQYSGWYCTPCESFWTELQLKEGKCPDCRCEVQQLSEENYFFKMSKYQRALVKHIKDHRSFIRPEIRRNEILSFLQAPLEDLCISRPRTRLAWGIDYPTSQAHVVYVWFDALVNYVSAAGYTVDEMKFQSLWPADIHMIGKDILRQHAVYWPTMLMACGVELPKTVLAHGWWTIAGAKVSKSRGNAVDPVELCKKYGVDAFRHFLLNEVTLGSDGAFSEDLLAERYTTDLANDLGNLWFRIAAMLEKYFGGRVPAWDAGAFRQEELKVLLERVHQAMVDYDPRMALAGIFGMVSRLNLYIEEKKPWVLARDEAQKAELAKTLGTLGEWVAHLAILLLPFLPETAGKILGRLKLSTEWVLRDDRGFQRPLLKAGLAVERGEALFPRLEDLPPHPLLSPPEGERGG